MNLKINIDIHHMKGTYNQEQALNEYAETILKPKLFWNKNNKGKNNVTLTKKNNTDTNTKKLKL